MLDLLSDILTHLSLKGVLYFRTSFTPPWGVAVPAYELVARFHFAHRGHCYVTIDPTGETVHLAQGDLIIIPHGASHALYHGPSPDAILPLDKVLEESGFEGHGVLVHGGGDGQHEETQLICGHFAFARHAHHVLIDRLPACLHVPNYGENAGRWMEATLRLIGDEAGGAKMGGDLIALRMSEVIFAQAIRHFIESQGTEHAGLDGFADPKLARALTAFHQRPAEQWTIDSLARVAGLSRTGFAQQFSQKMGMTPMHYLTTWRMQIARHCLAEQQMVVSEVAAIVGYQSDAAFARAFKKEVGVTPAAYRTAS